MILTDARSAPASGSADANCFGIGSIRVSLDSDLGEVLEDFTALYGACRTNDLSGEQTIRMRVRAHRSALPLPARYDVLGDGQELFTRCRRYEVLPYLEWAINWRVIARRTEFLQLHAAVLARDGQAVVFAGPSGSGKSTLAAGLLARGWRYLSDEFALVDPATLHVHPFPKALCVKVGSFAVLERLNMPIWRRRPYVKAFKGRVGYVRVHAIAGQVETRPCPIGFVLFPRYAAGADTHLYPVTQSRAAFALAAYTLNHGALAERSVPTLGQVVRNARCFGFVSSDLNGSCDLVERLLRS